MIKAILIDIDDTILDFGAYVRETMKTGFEKYGICRYDDSMYDTFKRVNTALWQELERGELTFSELTRDRWNRVFGALGLSFDGAEFERYFRAALFDSAIPVDGAYDMLGYLKDKYTLCAASNGPYAQQLNRLRVGKMDGYFTHFFISEAVGAQKPSPEFFRHCIDTLGIQPQEALMLGDSASSDIAGARAYGLKCCHFRGDADADYNITSLREIIDIL